MNVHPLDKFAPLAPHELASGPESQREDDPGECVMPVPDAAPTCPSSHHRLGAPSCRWTYLDRDGATLFHVCRFETTDGKEFRPLSLWRASNGRLEWRWKSVPEPRPIYHLDRLGIDPDAPIVIAEGEKATDAAALVFPKSIATTSPGGSQAASKASWAPLAGRKVLVWPDNDEPGSKYAGTVAAILAGLGCEVSMIYARELASIDPQGGAREPVRGWDAADAVAEWQDLGALRKAAASLAGPYHQGPLFVSWGDFTMDAKGLTTEVTKGRGDNTTTETVWIVAPFEILGACRDPHGRAWGKFLRWRDSDHRLHVRHVADAALQGEPAALCADLASDGFRINRSQQRALAVYLSGATVTGRVTVVNRTGWHDIGGQAVFMLAEQISAPRGIETVILDAAAIGPYEARGSLKDWQESIGTLASGHILPVLAISAAFAGPLLHLAGQEGGGVHVFGGSSKGKTTLLQMAASVWGRGATPGYVRAWRATANGLEGAAASASDTVLVLDELGVVDARDAAASIYGLANGVGKARAARDGSLREPRSWRVLVLSTGEVPTEAKLAEDRGRKARAGQLVRLLDIPADRGKGFGAFDHGGGDGNPGTLAKDCKQAAVSAYGTAGPEFVRRIIREGADDIGSNVRDIVSGFVAREVETGADGQIIRAAQRLGLIAAAGELATALGIVPWQEGEASAAAAWALARWVEGRGGTEPAEVRQAIEQVRLVIEQHGEARFDSLEDPDAKPASNRLGWRKGSGAAREWWIPPQVWRVEICAGLDPTMVARTLAERGMLRTQGGRGFQCKVNLGGDRRAQAYVLTAAIIDGGSDAP